MRKYFYRVGVVFQVILLAALYSQPAFSEELRGQTDAGGRFVLQVHTVPKAPNPDGVWGVIDLSYRSDGRQAQTAYTVAVQAPPIIRKNGFGLLTISEKIGGMNGTYKVAYLSPSASGLVAIGGVELSQDNGRYVDVSEAFPTWTKPADQTGLRNVVNAIIENQNKLIVADKGQSFDNALLFFAVRGLMENLMIKDSNFLVNFAKDINSEVDSSIANLIRRRLIGNKISLCGDDQFDVFVCKIGRKSLSVCSGVQDDANVLQYRVGTDRKIELSLGKSVSLNRPQRVSTESFKNDEYQYVVKFGDADWQGVVVEKNGTPVSELQCDSESMEPYLLPKI
jgi:hypothetical protein